MSGTDIFILPRDLQHKKEEGDHGPPDLDIDADFEHGGGAPASADPLDLLASFIKELEGLSSMSGTDILVSDLPVAQDGAARWTIGELNAILENNLVPCTKGHLRTFRAESKLFNGRPKAWCYPFDLPKNGLRGKTLLVNRIPENFLLIPDAESLPFYPSVLKLIVCKSYTTSYTISYAYCIYTCIQHHILLLLYHILYIMLHFHVFLQVRVQDCVCLIASQYVASLSKAT